MAAEAVLAQHTLRWQAEELMQALQESGVAAGVVRSSGGSHPVPESRTSAVSTISVFFWSLIRSATSAPRASATASRLRALVTRPR